MNNNQLHCDKCFKAITFTGYEKKHWISKYENEVEQILLCSSCSFGVNNQETKISPQENWEKSLNVKKYEALNREKHKAMSKPKEIQHEKKLADELERVR